MENGIKMFISVQKFQNPCLVFSWYAYSMNFLKTPHTAEGEKQRGNPALSSGSWVFLPVSSTFTSSYRLYVALDSCKAEAELIGAERSCWAK